MLSTSIGALLTGWSGMAAAYGAVEVPLLAGLVRARAPRSQLLTSPLLALPLLCAAGMGMAAVAPALRPLGADLHGLVQAGLGVALCAGCGYAGGRLLGRVRAAGPRYLRGAIVQESDGATEPDAQRQPERQAMRAAALTLAGLPLPAADETKHFKLIGTTGTGKSTAICELLSGALQRGDRAIIADPDGGYLRRYYNPERGDVILNPFDARSRRWDLFAEIRAPYDVEQIARALIPDAGADRSWCGYARTFFTAVTRQAHAAGTRDVAQLYRLLVVAEAAELRKLVRGTPAQPFLEEQNGRMFDSIRSVASSAVAALDYIGRQQAAPFSVRQWVAGGSGQGEARNGLVDPKLSGAEGALGGRGRGGVLFMPYQAGQIAALSSTISAWMRIALFEAMNQPEGDQRLWFVTDELDALGPIDGLKDALARLRKFGGRCVLGFQSIAQVAAAYGAGNARTIVENCGNTLILRCSASEGGGTSRFASQLIGQREVLRMSHSSSRRLGEIWGSRTRSEHLHVESAVMDSQIEQLPDLQGYLKTASGGHWRRVVLSVPAAPPAGLGSVRARASEPAAAEPRVTQAAVAVPDHSAFSSPSAGRSPPPVDRTRAPGRGLGDAYADDRASGLEL